MVFHARVEDGTGQFVGHHLYLDDRGTVFSDPKENRFASIIVMTGTAPVRIAGVDQFHWKVKRFL